MSLLDAAQIERETNALIAAAVPTETVWITDDELDARPELVKTMSVQPPRGAGRVRLLRIPGIDLQPCGGTHVANIAEIGAHPRAEDPQRRAAQPARRDRARRLEQRRQSGAAASSHSRSASSSGRWPATILACACSSVNHAARSTSGNDCVRPECFGHSISNMLLRTSAGSISPSAANACTVFARDCTTGGSGVRTLVSAMPVSSANSRRAAASGVFGRVELALRNRPGAVVATRPERAAGMHEQHLEPDAAFPVEQNARALRTGHCSSPVSTGVT